MTTRTDNTTATVPGLPRLAGAVYRRSLALQASWNTQRMQNLGLLACFVPWLRLRQLAPERQRRFCRRHFGYFNTNPYLANLIIGGLLRLEDDQARGETALPEATIVGYRDTLARACGSLGDQLFWLGLRPMVALLTVLLAVAGQGLAAVGVVVAFAACQMILRARWLEVGYASGLDIVDILANPAWHRAIVAAKRAALALTGLVAGLYFAGILDRAGGTSLIVLVAAALGGIVLPSLLRQRVPGEAQLVLSLALAWVLALLL